MRFELQTPSLQHQTLVKVVSHLLSLREIFTQIAGVPIYRIRKDRNEWKAIVDMAKNKLWALPLPETCKKQLFNFMKPLGMEINMWCEYHCVKTNKFQLLDNWLPNQLCWSMHGSIDYAKTAKVMVKDERLELETRYELACINCLEAEARQLFGSMGEEQRQEYVNRVRHFHRNKHHHLIVFFTCTLSGDEDYLQIYFHLFGSRSSLYKVLFEVMLPVGTPVTCEYLFTKLNQREKNQIFEERFYHRQGSSSGCSALHYLSLLNAELRERVLRESIGDLLLCLLRWPLQSLFMAVAERGWQLINNHARTQVLREIIFKIWRGFRDCDYAQLFWECWRLTPAECIKQHFLCDYQLLGDLVLTKREEIIQLVVNEGDLLFLSIVLKFGDYSDVLTDESVASDSVLMEWKETAVLNSENNPRDVEKRSRSEHVGRLIDTVMESRLLKRRRL